MTDTLLGESPGRPARSATDPRWPWLPYAAPMLAYVALTGLEDYLPRTRPGAPTIAHYPWVYAIKLGTVALIMILNRSTWRDLRPWPGPGTIALSVAIGVGVAVAWVGLDGRYPVWGTIGTRAAYDPSLLTPGGWLAFLAVRFCGLVVVVPLFEELFWRSFVVRWLIDPDDFRSVPIGRMTLGIAAITAGLFALEHPAEWLPALGTGLAWAWLLHHSRSVSACFLSHAVANLCLGVYVMSTGAWKFW